jgi:DNA-binding NarL/FixJ family response regulator
MMTIQIALVDDHRLFRSGIVSLINKFDGYNVLFEAANGEELIKKLELDLKPDIILLDINMPVMNGVDTARWLKDNHPGIKTIVLSMLNDPDKVLALLKAGIKGYLLKDSDPHEVEQALHKVSHGEVYYPEFVTRLLVDSINHPVDHGKLNQREIEFLKLAGTELTYKEIADQMRISVRTVDGYRDQLFEKLRVKSRVGLVLYAIKNKLIDL